LSTKNVLYATAVGSTPIDADLTPSTIVQESLAGESSSNEQTTEPPPLIQQRLHVCRKCKQPGHTRKDCPRQKNLSNQLNEHGVNNHVQSIEDM